MAPLEDSWLLHVLGRIADKHKVRRLLLHSGACVVCQVVQCYLRVLLEGSGFSPCLSPRLPHTVHAYIRTNIRTHLRTYTHTVHTYVHMPVIWCERFQTRNRCTPTYVCTCVDVSHTCIPCCLYIRTRRSIVLSCHGELLYSFFSSPSLPLSSPSLPSLLPFLPFPSLPPPSSLPCYRDPSQSKLTNCQRR